MEICITDELYETMTSGNDNLEKKIFSSCMLALKRHTEDRSIPDILKKGTTQNTEGELYLRIVKKRDSNKSGFM